MRALARALVLAGSVVTAVTALAAGALLRRPSLGDGSIAAELPVRRVPSALPAALRRPIWRDVAGDSLASATDFTRLGDTLVVLDGRAHRVRLLRLEGQRWTIVGGWGRRGGGPGEWHRPAAIAAAGGDTIAVLERSGRLQRFTRDGRLLATEPAALPCVMPLPVLAYSADGTRWVAGPCAGPGASRDTIFTFLFRARPGGEYEEVAREPRVATDLTWGSAFATAHPLVDGGSSILFGTGLDACVHYQPPATPGATPRRRCGLAREQLTAPPRPELEQARRRAEAQGNRLLARALRWSERLPAWWAVVAGREAAGGESLVLARPYQPDSLVLIAAGAPFAPEHVRLVAPIGGLVACVRGGCLWLDRETGRLAFHDASGADAAGTRPR